MNARAHPLVLLLLLLAPAALAQGPTTPPTGATPSQPTIADGDNGMDTSFARIATDPRPTYKGPGTPVEAIIVIKNASRVEDCHILMFAFNGLNPSVKITLDGLTTDGGLPVRIEQDNRSESAQQPKVWIKPADLVVGEPLHLRGRVEATSNGQFHVGAIVIAFDPEYRKFVTPRNEFAEVYAFGLLAASDAGVDNAGPPFEGQGNVAAPGIVWLLLLAVGVALSRRRR